MTSFEGINEQPPQDPTTRYIFREAGGDNPPPPEFQTLAPVPLWRLLGEEENPMLRPPAELREKQIYSAIVFAAVNGALDRDALEFGRRPRVRAIFQYAGRSVQERGEKQFRNDLRWLPQGEILKAHDRAGEINWAPYDHWPGRTAQPRQQNSYTRFMENYNAVARHEGALEEAYFSWDSVCAYYEEAMSQTVQGGQPPDGGWGRVTVKDLAEHVAHRERDEMMAEERHYMEDGFLDLDGIPYLDDPEGLVPILKELPAGTPALCFTSNHHAIAVRTGQESQLHDLQPKRWSKQMVLLFNLIMLQGLRTAGRAVTYGWLERVSGYTPHKMGRQFEFLDVELGRKSGINLLRKEGRSGPQNSLRIQDRAFILDARPPLAQPDAEETAESPNR